MAEASASPNPGRYDKSVLRHRHKHKKHPEEPEKHAHEHEQDDDDDDLEQPGQLVNYEQPPAAPEPSFLESVKSNIHDTYLVNSLALGNKLTELSEAIVHTARTAEVALTQRLEAIENSTAVKVVEEKVSTTLSKATDVAETLLNAE
eukprot:c21436_g1_i1.p1 GENE.c21436_g1_i1~~c21436_g1_i1.p1  ORF type:complete len:158 (+),score=23.94 c21436_g1_i1:36-476(+)